MFKLILLGSVMSFFCLLPALKAGTCCNTPTIWTFKNLDSVSVTLQCNLEKSVAWSGKPISMVTKPMAPGVTYKHTWDRGWYSDGMGMIPGQWVCRSTGGGAPSMPVNGDALNFATDWGENISILWSRGRATVAKAK
jgi:hypothetical protein